MFLKVDGSGVLAYVRLAYVRLSDGAITIPEYGSREDLEAQPVEPVSGAFVEGHEG